ncbi:hypothetical protein [Maribacter sp. 2-571]|uniref:hypothetical protein n=1 Tax=Maribacter sp. 2-571 TaxID=3417569 RepID=UPI003D349D69
MSSKMKAEIKWILLSGLLALALTSLLFLEFENYYWTLAPQHSHVLWVLWFFLTVYSLVGGIVYFIRMLLSKGQSTLKNQLTLFFLIPSVAGMYQMARITSRLDHYLLPTSKKTANGFTIYPPLSATAEQTDQLAFLKNQAPFVFGLAIFLMFLLVATLFITWKNKTALPNA